MHLACFFCADKIVEYLTNSFEALNLDIDARDNFGYTPAILTCIHPSESDELISHKAGMSPQESRPGTPKNKDKQTSWTLRRFILMKLTEKGSKWAEHSYKKTYNPLHWAIMNGDVLLVEYIVRTRPEFSSFS